MLVLCTLTCWWSTMVVQVICNHQAVGSTPITSSNGFIVAMVKQVCGMD